MWGYLGLSWWRAIASTALIWGTESQNAGSQEGNTHERNKQPGEKCHVKQVTGGDLPAGPGAEASTGARVRG